MKGKRISKAAVLGAGAMGSKIAVLLAGVGIPTYLLDIVPKELDQRDVKKGLTKEAPGFRNKLAQMGLDSTLMASPPGIYAGADAKLVTPGNFEDHMSCLSDVDWIIEAVVENLEIKRELLRKAESFRKPGTIISTNTSGLPVNLICQELPEETRAHFLGTHFFNPPRHMKLMEIVPGNSTDKAVVAFMAEFCERELGKSVVFAKDTPTFIANRIGAHALIGVVKTMLEDGYTIEEVDAITGPPMGRPRVASFRTADMVGLDVFVKVAQTVRDNVENAAEKEDFTVPAFVTKMLEAGLLGDKTQKGFYKKVLGADGSQIYALDYNSVDYVPRRQPDLPVLDKLSQVVDPAVRLQMLTQTDDRAGRFAWKVLKKMLLYCAAKVPEISDDILGIDRAMRWGFNWELGPFEMWDAIGLKGSVDRMEAEGEKIPESIRRMLASGRDRFYDERDGGRRYFDFLKADYGEIEEKPQIVLLPSLKEIRKVVLHNEGASLVDMGDGVACLEFHSANNVIDGDVIQMIGDSIAEVEDNFEGLVIGNQGVNFCVGADVKLISGLCQEKDWATLETAVSQFQQACMRMKFSQKPVVAAPFRMTLGGGCEVCMAASMVRANAEAYMGLVEMGVGLIPGGGGNKEMLLRAIDWVPPSVPSAVPGGGRPDLIPYVARTLETIAMAKVAMSAKEAQEIGYMRPYDRITMNLDYLLHDAKQSVLVLARDGYRPPRQRDDIRVTGRTGMGILELMVYLMHQAGYITDHDALVAKKLAYVLTGGDLDQNTLVTEQYLLDLEREAFLSLCGEEKTQARLKHMADTNKPLRN
jgi:3-hydroxyacyl-CoA dehydrogenase